MEKLCLIADIVKSRILRDRQIAQETLEKSLESINGESSASLISPFTITLGDEFQAVYRDFSCVFGHVVKILYDCYPLRIRFALGYGEVVTRINPVAAIGMDGPGFYAARDLLESLKSKKTTVFGLRMPAVYKYSFADASLRLASDIIGSLNKTSLGCCAYALRGYNPRQIHEVIGPELGITDKMVYKSLSMHNIPTIVGYFNSLAKELGDMTNGN